MTTAAELLARTDCADLRATNADSTAERHSDRPRLALERAGRAAQAEDHEQEAPIEALRKDLTGAAAERAFDAGEIARLVAVVTQLRKDLADQTKRVIGSPAQECARSTRSSWGIDMRIYDPAKRHARSIVRSAVRNGTLPKANTQRCAGERDLGARREPT